MNSYSDEEVIRAWTTPLDERQAQDLEAYRESMRVTDLMLQLLAQGEPVSASRFAQVAGVPQAEVQEFFDGYQESGGEFDDEGRLVGAALTLNPTPH